MGPELHLHQASMCEILVGLLPVKILPGLLADWAMLRVHVY